MDNFENVESIYSTTEPQNEDTFEYADFDLADDMSEIESEVTGQTEEPTVAEMPKPVQEVKASASDNKAYETDKVVPVYSSKNLFKYGLGGLDIGYSVITQKEADFWLGHKAVRSATPEEVAKEYLG
jgi:hypothetical protein